MVSPVLLSFVLLATIERFLFVNAASPITHAPRSSSDAPDGAPSALVATAKLAGSFNVTGQLQFSLQSGTGPVAVSLEIDGLNALNSSGMYTYHIHTNPISSDGNCSSALGHLDPLAVTEALICSPQMPQYCQEGDLAGRNGKLNASELTTKSSYVDNYLRFWPQPFSILGRSVVVHLPNATRIACGNITSVVDGTATSEGLPTFSSSNYTTQYPSHGPQPTPVKYQPFVGTTPNATAIAEITLPFPLPTTQNASNIILGTAPSNQTVNGKAQSVTVPAALNAPSEFSYTPGAPLPTQNDTSLASNDSSTTSSRSRNAAANGLAVLAPPPVASIGIVGLCFLAFI